MAATASSSSLLFPSTTLKARQSFLRRGPAPFNVATRNLTNNGRISSLSPASSGGVRLSRGRKKVSKSPRGSTNTSGQGDGEESDGIRCALEDSTWETRLHEVRKWGHRLEKTSGSDKKQVTRLLKTLRDTRCKSEGALRRTAIEALIPAATVGHRGALSSQIRGLEDENKAVRHAALRSLQVAAGGTRAQLGGAVAVELSESFTSLQDQATPGSVEVRRARANVLAQLAPRGDSVLTAAAVACLKDEDVQVRCWSTQAVGHTGTSDDIHHIVEQLEDSDWQVQQAAVEALASLAHEEPFRENGDAVMRGRRKRSTAAKSRGVRSSGRHTIAGNALGAPRQTIGGGHSPMQKAAGQSSNLSTPDQTPLATPSGSRAGTQELPVSGRNTKHRMELGPATMALVEALRADSSLLGLPKEVAVAAVGRVATLDVGETGKSTKPVDRTPAVAACAARLGDFGQEVRHEAVTAVTALALADPERCIRQAAAQLLHLDFRARGAAGQALAGAAENAAYKEGPQMTAHLLSTAALGATEILKKDDWAGRRGAGWALRLLAGHSSGTGATLAVHALHEPMKHKDWSVRRKAVQSLASVAEVAGGDSNALKMLVVAAKDKDEEVRLAVATAIPAVAPRKSKKAIRLVAQMAANGGEQVDVRLEALASLEVLASSARSRSRVAIQLVTSMLEDDHPQVWACAKHVLITIGRGRRTAIDKVVECLAHPRERARRAAVDIFGSISQGAEMRAVKRTVPLLSHTDEGVREAAKEALESCGQLQDAGMVAAAAAATARFRPNRLMQPEVRGRRSGTQVGDSDEEVNVNRTDTSKQSSQAAKASKRTQSPPSPKQKIVSGNSPDNGKTTRSIAESVRAHRSSTATDDFEPELPPPPIHSREVDSDGLSESDTDSDEELTSAVVQWVYNPPDTPQDLRLRMLPGLEEATTSFALRPGDVFYVSEEFRGSEGITYLHLADGRGWAPSWSPGLGQICEMVEADAEKQAKDVFELVRNDNIPASISA